jgi:hypothetical protein
MHIKSHTNKLYSNTTQVRSKGSFNANVFGTARPPGATAVLKGCNECSSACENNGRQLTVLSSDATHVMGKKNPETVPCCCQSGLHKRLFALSATKPDPLRDISSVLVSVCHHFLQKELVAHLKVDYYPRKPTGVMTEKISDCEQQQRP